MIKVFDKKMKLLAYLDKAYSIGYELPLNELYTADFSLPADDPKNQYCEPFNYVEIFDGPERVELFRIMPSVLTRNDRGDVQYQCEHVLATLLDDVLFQYHQIGNVGTSTNTVLRYVLDRQDSSKWQLGESDFTRFFEYKWENENLLSALFSIPQPFDEPYRWEFDTTSQPWRIHLKKLPTKFKADITYKKNMLEIKKTVDPTTIVNRLYCLGYGEGDNQLDIKSVNGGLAYLQAGGSIDTWGLKQSILVDRRFENPTTLKAYGQTLLDGLKDPYKSYEVQAIDLHRISPDKYEKYKPGDIVRIIDKEDGVMEDLPVVKVSKTDISNGGDVRLEIANKSRDLAGSISDLQNRTRINEVYAQGATNQMIVPYSDNADPSNPAVLKFYIPDTMARINKLILNYEIEPFRAYSKAIQSTPVQSKTSESAGRVSKSTLGGGGTRVGDTSGTGEYTLSMNRVYDYVSWQQNHNHGIDSSDVPGFVSSGGHSHSLDWDHVHGFSLELEDHTHSFEIDGHTHSFEIPSHSHNLEFGIYQGTTAESVSIRVDGKTISYTGNEVDLIPHLSADGGGKIQRNTWHKVELIPNKMTRIQANIFMQIFTNSRGGGDF